MKLVIDVVYTTDANLTWNGNVIHFRMQNQKYHFTVARQFRI